MAGKRSVKADERYNARKRFLRAASRYLDKAADTVGAERARYMELARTNSLKAAELYTRNADINRSSLFQRVSKEFGINIKEFVSKDGPNQRETERQERLIQESYGVRKAVETERGTFRPLTSEETRTQEARSILNSKIGSRIYAGLVDVWATPTFEEGQLVNRRKQEDINRLIMKHFGVDNMMDVIEILQKANPDLFADPESIERYDTIRQSIQLKLYE